MQKILYHIFIEKKLSQNTVTVCEKLVEAALAVIS